MAKLPRKTVVQFGSTGVSTDFGEFGSEKAGTPQTSQDPAVIQSLGAWLTGWATAAIGAAFNPFLEDMNGLCFVFGYFLANIFERGIPDWDAGTTYYKGAFVQDPAGSGQRFFSLTDSNLNNALPLGASNAQWQWDNPPVPKDGGLTVHAIPRVSAAAPSTLSPGLLSDDGTNVIIGGVAGTNGLKFPDGTAQKTAAQSGVVTAQGNLGPTGSNARAEGVTYQNTGTKPIFVSIVFVPAVNAGASAVSDATATPAIVVWAASVNGGANTPTIQLAAFFVVLPGNYYKCTGPAVQNWIEWS